MPVLSFGDKLKKIRIERNMSQEELGELLGTSKQVISRYETNQRTPKITIVEEYAKRLNIPLDYLINNSVVDIKDVHQVIPTDSNITNNAIPPLGAIKSLITSVVPGNMVNLPIVGKISCGNGVLAYEDIEGYESTPTGWLNGGEYFYTRAKGNSMINARIYSGDLVLIRKQPDVEDGEIAAILIDEEIFLKRVYKRNGSVILQSENPEYPPIIADLKNHNCNIVGKLKKVIINM